MDDSPHMRGCQSGDALSDLAEGQQLALLRDVIDASPNAVIVHEPGGDLVFYSEGTCRLLGLSSEQMLGLRPFGWVAPEGLKNAPQRLEKILHEGQLTFVSSVVRHDGTRVPTEVTATRIDSEMGPLVVATIRDLSEQAAANEHLQYLAYHDALTGLASRAAFNERLQVAIADSRRHGDVVVIAYIDLDRFKPINDRYGHEAGDQVLIAIGRRLRECVREQDLVARLGGDEFVVLLGRVNSIDEVPEVATRLLNAIRQPLELPDTTCEVGASVGFAVFDPETDDARTVVMKADIAMYEAKNDPVHPWLLYDSGMGEVAGIGQNTDDGG